MTGHDWIDKDFYRVLGVSKDADQKTIKKAYRKLARKYHPDQNTGNANAEKRFKEIGEAYNVLSNPQQKKQYDAIRTMAGGGARFSAGPGGGAGAGFDDVFASMFGAGRGGGGFPGGNSNSYTFNSGDGGAGLDDLLSGLFGGGQPGPSEFSGAGRSTHPFGFPQGQFDGSRQKGRDLAAKAQLTLSQAIHGATLKLTVEGHAMTVRVPAGVSDGQKLRIKGKGRPSSQGGQPGDLVLNVSIETHPYFSIKNKKLYMKLPISVEEAVCGASVIVPLLDKKKVKVKIPPGTSSGTLMRVKGKGIPGKKGAEGDLYIEISIVVDSQSSQAACSAAKHFTQATQGFDPRGNLGN